MTARQLNVRSKHWFITWNNHQDKVSINVLLSIRGLCKYVIQEETGDTTGTPHLQGVMSFKHQKSWMTLRNIAKIYWSKCRNIPAARNYCSKIETRNGKQWKKGYKTLNQPVFDPMTGKNFHTWQTDIIDLIAEVPDQRSIYWYWSHCGNIGKTSLAKHLCLKYNAVLGGGRAADSHFAITSRIKEGKPVEIVLFNLPRSKGNKIDYEGLESIKDGMIFSSKYESKQCLFDCPHVIIFANFPPDLSQLSPDRWKVKCLDTLDFNVNRD